MVYWRKISSIREGEVAILGVVTNVVENYLVVEDGTARARVYYDKASELEPKDIVLVVGIVITSSKEFKEVQAYAVTKLKGVSINLLRRIGELRDEVERLIGGEHAGE